LPLYAYLLAGIYQICGYSPFVPGLLQAGCEGGTAVLLYQLSALIFPRPYVAESKEENSPSDLARRPINIIGILAVIGWALFQPAQGYSVILMPTAWLVFVFWFVVWQIVKRRQAPAPWKILLLGVLIGFTAMGIATILFLVPLVFAALSLRWAASVPHRITGAVLMVAGIFIGASPAWIHNCFVARDPVFLSAHSGVNFWIGNNPMANGYPRFPPGLHAGQQAMLKDSIATAEKAAGHPLKRSEVSAFWSQKARAWIQSDPLAWVKLLGIKLKNFWNAFQYDDLSIITALRDEAIILPGLGFGLVAALGLPGLLLACWKIPVSRWIAGAVLLHMSSLLPVFVTERYRLAAVPGLLLFAAFGLATLWREIATARYREAAIFLLLLFAGTALVSLPQENPTFWSLDSYNSGVRALEANNLRLAGQKLDLAYAYSPANAGINFALGNLRLAEGNKEAAGSFYRATLRLDPTHGGAYNNLGVLALEEGHWPLAVAFFQHAIELSPNDAKTHFLFARAELKAGEVGAARREIERAIQLDPSHPEFLALQQEIENAGR
jgi:tetratricopeptide (TPR) repeat protein